MSQAELHSSFKSLRGNSNSTPSFRPLSVNESNANFSNHILFFANLSEKTAKRMAYACICHFFFVPLQPDLRIRWKY